MKLPFVSRRAYDAVCADRERIRGERTQFAEDRDGFKAAAEIAARRFAEADAANQRLSGRLLELGRRLSALTEADPEYAAALERRLRRLAEGTARWMSATWSVRAEAARQAMVLEKNKTALEAMEMRLADAEEARPADGAPAVRDMPESAVVLREKARADALADRLAELTVANQKCTCQRPLATEGVAS